MRYHVILYNVSYNYTVKINTIWKLEEKTYLKYKKSLYNLFVDWHT